MSLDGQLEFQFKGWTAKKTDVCLKVSVCMGKLIVDFINFNCNQSCKKCRLCQRDCKTDDNAENVDQIDFFDLIGCMIILKWLKNK